MLRYRLMLLFSQIARRAPASVTYALAWCAGTAAYYFNGPAREVAEANIRHVLGAEAPAADVRRAVKGCFRAAAHRFRPGTDFRGLAELALNVMEGGVMQSRTYRDVGHFDRAVAQFRIAVDAMLAREAAA